MNKLVNENWKVAALTAISTGFFIFITYPTTFDLVFLLMFAVQMYTGLKLLQVVDLMTSRFFYSVDGTAINMFLMTR